MQCDGSTVHPITAWQAARGALTAQTAAKLQSCERCCLGAARHGAVPLAQGGRDQGTVHGVLQDYLVTDEVVASKAQTMEDTLRYLDTQYGGIEEYLEVIGIRRSEV